MDKESLDYLRTLGFNQYESRIYLSLLLIGSMSASELSDNADIPRPRTYDVLDKLSKRGFVSIQPGRPTRFQAFPIKEAFNNLKKEKQKKLETNFIEIDKIEGKLNGRVKNLGVSISHNPSDLIWVLKERSNIYSKMEDLIQNASDSIIISSTKEGIKRKLNNYDDILKKAKGRGVSIKVITPHAIPELESAKAVVETINSEEKHRMVIVDDEALVFLTPEEDEKSEIAAWIRSPYFTENLRKHLE